MSDESLVQQLTSLAALLAEVDSRLAKSPVAPAGLEHLKQTVDNLRTSMWAVLQAGSGITAPVRVERLKIRRSIEGLRALEAELASRPTGAILPDYQELATTASRLAATIESRR